MKEFRRSPEITLLWNLEVLGIRSADSTTANIDDTIVREFCATRRFDKDLRRFFVSFPQCFPAINLPSHFRMCVARLKSLVRTSSAEVLNQYHEILQEYL